MLRLSSTDPIDLEERREQEKVFALLLTLNSSYNDLIKHMLKAKKLPSLDDVCAQIQKDQGSVELFGGKGDLNMAPKAEAAEYKAAFKPENRRVTCDQCKKSGRMKNK